MHALEIIVSKIKKDAVDEKKVYEMYYDYSEKTNSIANHRVMAIDRAEKEKVITVSFDYDKERMIEDAPKKADERNRELASGGKFELKKGYLVKGVYNTEYIPSMLDRGILAKDFHGQTATSDGTPCDMDTEMVIEEGDNFRNTLKKYPEIDKRWHIFKHRTMSARINEWYNSLREIWGLEKLDQLSESDDALVHDDFSFEEYNFC